MPISREIQKAVFRIPGLGAAFGAIQEKRYIQDRNRRFPQMRWEKGSSCEVERVEATRVVDGGHVFAVGGYIELSRVSQRVDRYDMENDRWQQVATLPDGMAQTHNGVAFDARDHAYILTGQLGVQCSPATQACWSFGTKDHQWHELPPLPEPRYMPLVHFGRGRLHCMAGALPNRLSKAHQHWSIAVENGRAIEDDWRVESDLGWSRIHTAVQSIGDELLLFGGQTGDVQAIKDDPGFHCDFSHNEDVYYDEVFRFNLLTGARRDLVPMHVPNSHTEYGVVAVGPWILVCGGIHDRRVTSDWIQAYHVERDEWREVGRLPFNMKSKITAVWKDRLFVMLGQKANSETDFRPGLVSNEVWHAPLPDWMVNS